MKVKDQVREFKSATGTIWKLRDIDERAVAAIAQKFDIPEIVARVVSLRGIDVDNVEKFLNPTIKNYLPDPMEFLDMEKAANRLADAVMNGEEIAIFGDYDVDGATSSALLKRFFREVDADPIVYIPDRIKEGYGPNTNALLELHEQGAKVCITVDCGTSAFEPLAAAAKAGLEVIVIDHHLGGEKLPEAVAIVNPNRLDETSKHGHLAAVGMAFLLVVAVNTKLREKNWYDDKEAPNLLNLLDLVALGTVCDVVHLKGVNRAFVAQGLKIMRKRNNIGLNMLIDVVNINSAPGTYHLGFVLGPRINAGGRVGQANFGARLLSTEDLDEADEIAKELNKFNAERKAIEQMVMEEAVSQVEEKGVDGSIVIAKSEGWHPGVIGIVASRLKERFNRPAAVISLSDGIGKASARSINGIDFGSAVVAANQSGLLVTGGGHAMAAGFTVKESKIDELEQFFSKKFGENIEKLAVRTIKLDGKITIAGVTTDFASLLQQVEPFGAGNAEPRFIIENVCIVKVDIIGGDHVRCILSDANSGGQGGTIKAMAFRSLEAPLGKALLSNRGNVVNIAGRVRLNNWQGVNRVEMLIDDVAI